MCNNLIPIYDDYNIHSDIINLLWIKDENIFDYDEPSMIDGELPISRPKTIKSVVKPSYYPSYSRLSPNQRWIYLQFLKNPYRANIDIGYVFILYYGLERHLIEGDYQDAFEVILNLRKKHQNNSFQAYSLRSLLAICLINRDAEMFEKIKNSLSSSAKDVNTVMIINALSFTDLTAEFITNNTSFFGFRKTKYIKQSYNLFCELLKKMLYQQYGSYEFPISSYVDNPMDTITQVGFANMSLSQRDITIPNFKTNGPFINDIYALLDETHNFIKNSK